MPKTSTGPATVNSLAAVPATRPSVLNSNAGETMALAKPVMGQRPRPRPLGQLVKPAQAGKQGCRPDEGDRYGRARHVLVQPQTPVKFQQILPQGADGPAHQKGPGHIPAQWGLLGPLPDKGRILFLCDVHRRSLPFIIFN